VSESLTADELLRLLGKPSPQIIAAADNKINECIELLQSKIDFGRPLIKPRIEYDLRGTTAGQAWGKSKIRLNIDILNDPNHFDDMINQTLPHELAHCVVSDFWPNAQAHGTHWAYIMMALDLPARRCHNYDTKPARVRARYHYHCSCIEGCYAGPTVHRKIQAGAAYKCRHCNRVLINVQFTQVR
jgi:SprT protein